MLNKFKINFESSLTRIILYSLVILTAFIVSSIIGDRISNIYFKNSREIEKLLDIKNDISPDKIDIKKVDQVIKQMNHAEINKRQTIAILSQKNNPRGYFLYKGLNFLSVILKDVLFFNKTFVDFSL